MNLRFSGAFQVRVIRPDGSVRLETELFDNLITNSGLDWLGSVGSPYVYVTTGTTPPSVGDTTVSGTILGEVGLGGPVVVNQTATLPNYATTTYTTTFGVGVVVGSISELAIGSGLSGGTPRLFSRALITNSQGVPITISLTATDQLQIAYVLKQYIPDGDTSFTLDVNGVTRTFTVRPCRTTSSFGWSPSLMSSIAYYYDWTDAFSGTIGPRTGDPSGSQWTSSTRNMLTYSNGTYRRGFNMEWAPNKGNLTIASFRLIGNGSCAGSWQLGVSPSIVKTNLQTLRIDGEYSWGRYVP